MNEVIGKNRCEFGTLIPGVKVRLCIRISEIKKANHWCGLPFSHNPEVRIIFLSCLQG